MQTGKEKEWDNHGFGKRAIHVYLGKYDVICGRVWKDGVDGIEREGTGRLI